MKIRLMADYGCYPLSWADVDKAGNIDPKTLPPSQETIARFQKWEESYNKKLNWDDPDNSSGFSAEEEESFDEEGISLWKELQEELTPDYEVVYFNKKLHRVV